MPGVVVLDPEPRTRRLPFRLDASGWPLLAPTLLSIHRTSSRDEQSRQIVCRLDGQVKLQLLYGQEVTIEIPPGHHTLRVHNTLVWKNLTFEAEPGAHLHFTVLNRPCFAYYLLAICLGAAPLWLEVERGAPSF